MEDYQLLINSIEHYKNKACELLGDNCDKCDKCDKCEACYRVNYKQFCCFDTVNRFIKYANGEF